MIERGIQSVEFEQGDGEDVSATRERLRAAFPRSATRRMTQLGLLVGRVLGSTGPRQSDTLVYASSYSESRALEDYLASFPAPSPTLFQSSIHPSAVQQALIALQQPVREVFPMTGNSHLVAHAVQAALLSPAERTILCGGEERGTWLAERGVASERSFAFALALSRDPATGLGRLAIGECGEAEGELSLPEFLEALKERRPLRRVGAPGIEVILSWN